MEKSDFVLGKKYLYKYRGIGEFSEIACQLEKSNPDLDSIFLDFDGET